MERFHLAEMVTLHCPDVSVTQLGPKVAACDFLRRLLELVFFWRKTMVIQCQNCWLTEICFLPPSPRLKTKPGSGFPHSMVCQVLEVFSDGVSNIKTVGASPGEEGQDVDEGVEHLP